VPDHPNRLNCLSSSYLRATRRRSVESWVRPARASVFFGTTTSRAATPNGTENWRACASDAALRSPGFGPLATNRQATPTAEVEHQRSPAATSGGYWKRRLGRFCSKAEAASPNLHCKARTNISFCVSQALVPGIHQDGMNASRLHLLRCRRQRFACRSCPFVGIDPSCWRCSIELRRT
jgi:hypothetical protein